jgi:hypothetical protein
MQLEFEVINTDVGDGNYPDLIHFANTQAQVFYLQDGELFGKPSNKIDNGEWQNTIFQDEVDASPDTGMSHFEVKVLPGWGIIGGYKAGDIHKMVIYEFAWEMDRYLNSGSIKHSIDNPISSFTLSLENPDLNDPEHPGNIAINEENSLLSPGAKVTFKFGAGDDLNDYEMGVFYVDRSNFTLLNETASVDGRNLIGKALKDQTLDESYQTGFNYNNLIIEKFFKHANLDSNQYLIENTSARNWFDFKPNMDILSALNEIFKAMLNWKVRELTDGTIVVGSPNFSWFTSNGVYNFYRNKDIFSRGIVRDDMGAYRRVCIHDSDFNIVVYKDVKGYSGWNLQAKKTLYVQVANGTRLSEANLYAEEVANRVDSVGKIESFTGPLRPHLTCGDEAVIIDEKGSKSLGLITEITHVFGKSGYYTNFTVDSGGRLGKGRLTDYIGQITKDKTSGSIGYEEIIE